MEKIHKSELFVVPQFERVQKMRAVIPEWMSELASNQMLVIGLPPVLGPWSDAVPLVVGGHMITEFIAWLDDSEESISELHYSLPALNAKFLLIVTDSTYDLDVDGLPDDASEQMIATLNCLAKAQAVEA